MPVVACPSCATQLDVPEDFVGRTVRCASCSTAFEANPTQPERPPAQRPVAEDRYSDQPAVSPGERRPEYVQDGPDRRQEDWQARDEPRRDDYRPRDYEEEEDRRRRFMRRDLVPHRGGMILTMGIISAVGGTVGGLLCIVLFVVGIGLGVATVLMGRGDLQQIDAGAMDPDGRGQTKAGIICGIVGLIGGFLLLLACGAYLVLMFSLGGFK